MASGSLILDSDELPMLLEVGQIGVIRALFLTRSVDLMIDGAGKEAAEVLRTLADEIDDS